MAATSWRYRSRADKLPPKPAGFVRDFVLSVVGWDEDATNHRWLKMARREPLPFGGCERCEPTINWLVPQGSTITEYPESDTPSISPDDVWARISRGLSSR